MKNPLKKKKQEKKQIAWVASPVLAALTALMGGAEEVPYGHGKLSALRMLITTRLLKRTLRGARNA